MAKKGDTSPKIPGDDWVNAQWRPMMAWAYMVIVLFDFILAPVLWGGLQAFFNGTVAQQWVPLTLGGGGLFHMAMGAIVGVSAWSRGREKISAMETRWSSADDSRDISRDRNNDDMSDESGRR